MYSRCVWRPKSKYGVCRPITKELYKAKRALSENKLEPLTKSRENMVVRGVICSEYAYDSLEPAISSFGEKIKLIDAVLKLTKDPAESAKLASDKSEFERQLHLLEDAMVRDLHIDYP